jgi:hypothetical protein
MNPIQIYESFIIKANKNAQTDNTAVDKGRFTKIYNEASNKFVEWTLDKKNGEDIKYIQELLDTKNITETTVKSNYQLFTLPKDYFASSTLSAKATGGCCTNIDMEELFEIKSDNESILISDSNTKPSIEYRGTIYYFQNNTVKIFTDDFKIDSIGLTYYKKPSYIFLVDEDDPESGFKEEAKHLNLSDKAIDRIVSIAVSDYDLNTGDPKYQADKMRVISKS